MGSSRMTQYSPAEPDSGLLVTIVVPVFNTSPQLVERAVVSALKQTHSNLELMIVDDGSTPETAKFLDHVALRDPRIRVVHRTNGGVSAARNTGVKCALGDFIAYLDSDDYLEPGFLAAALAAARTADAGVVFGGMRVLYPGGSADWRTGGPSSKEPLLGTPDAIEIACVRALADSPSHRKATELLSVTNVVACLYSADTARRHRFREGVSHAEDRLHNVDVLLDVARVAFCSDVWYVYDTTDDQGATRRATPQTVTALAQTIHAFAGLRSELLRHNVLSNDARERIAVAAAGGVLSYLKVLSGVTAALGRSPANRAQLHQLLSDPTVREAIAHTAPSGWQNKIFAAAARRRGIDLLLLSGWFWMRTRGLQMSVERPVRRSWGRKNNNG